MSNKANAVQKHITEEITITNAKRLASERDATTTFQLEQTNSVTVLICECAFHKYSIFVYITVRHCLELVENMKYFTYTLHPSTISTWNDVLVTCANSDASNVAPYNTEQCKQFRAAIANP